mgnify:CR=1 FL=1
MSFARVSDIVQFSRRDLKGFEKDVLRFGNDGRRALRNAHKAAVDIVNQDARDKYQKMTIRQGRREDLQAQGQRSEDRRVPGRHQEEGELVDADRLQVIRRHNSIMDQR